ncbi:MAG TPA: hypothetical protein VFB62_11375, partial [Polyangiaceae bacterium]|nr:hypothetical protein [Polyangiaceae bacterium]
MRRGWLALALVLGCTPPGSGARPQGSLGDQPVRPDAPQCKRAPATVVLSAEGHRLRARGIAALDAGNALEARRAFEEVLARHPGNVATLALALGAQEAIERVQQDAARALDNVKAVKLAPPPIAYRLDSRVAVPASAPPRLTLESRTANKVTDV